ncbi:sensor histidine kinase N-terminal domain-containing protein [Xanthobacter sp. AM11]|uniref:sensor histidine kinase n=1 Tax=Xanthobacter sp. AM11 TaxID=3380643 RepID=UPI0039BF63A7
MQDRPLAGSLTRRLAVAMVLVFAAGAGAVAVAALAYGSHAAQEAYDRLLVGAANQISGALRIENGAVVLSLPASAFELLALAPDDRVIYGVFGPQGKTITGYGEASVALAAGTPYVGGIFAGEPVRMAVVRRDFSERSYNGTVTVVVGQTLTARTALARDIARQALLLAGLVGVALAGLAVFAVRSALGPLKALERDLAGRDPDDLTPLKVDVPREIGGLVAAINHFMARVDRQAATMRNFIGDTAHQLRTPVAALRVQADLAAEESDIGRQRILVARIHDRAVGLSRLTDQLLSHAMIIHRRDSVPLGRLDLRTAAMRAVDESDHELLADAPLELELPEAPLWCRGDALSLVEAVKNLVANARRYGRPPVTVYVRRDRGHLNLGVRDHGPGMPRAARTAPRRRYKEEAGVTSSSAGLGLAIVRAVAEAHGGRLTFAHTADRAFEAYLVLPESSS